MSREGVKKSLEKVGSATGKGRGGVWPFNLVRHENIIYSVKYGSYGYQRQYFYLTNKDFQ